MMLGVQQTELGQECFTGRKFYHPYPKVEILKQTDSFPFCLQHSCKRLLCMEMFAEWRLQGMLELFQSKETAISRCSIRH